MNELSYVLRLSSFCKPTVPTDKSIQGEYSYSITKSGILQAFCSGIVRIGPDTPLISPALVAFQGLKLGLRAILNDYEERDYTGGRIQVYSPDIWVSQIMNKTWKPQPDTVYYNNVLDSFQLLLALRRRKADVSFDHLEKHIVENAMRKSTTNQLLFDSNT